MELWRYSEVKHHQQGYLSHQGNQPNVFWPILAQHPWDKNPRDADMARWKQVLAIYESIILSQGKREREVFQLWKQNYLFSHYLDKVVSQNIPKCSKSVCHRLAAVDLAVIPFLAFPNIIICCYPKHFLLKSCTKKYTPGRNRLFLEMEM